MDSLCILAALLACIPGSDPVPDPTSNLTPDVIPSERHVRAEFFLMEEAPVTAEPGEEALDFAPIGVVAWRHVRSVSSELLEREVYFRADKIEVHHSEQLVAHRTAGSPRLVFREKRRDGGRTWLAQLDRAMRHAETTSWGGKHALHEVRDYESGVQLPLALLELIRAGLVIEGRFECLDPLIGGDTGLFVTTLPGFAGVGGWVPAGLGASLSRRAPDRTVELRRDDSRLAGRFVFRGSELLAFQWQEGGAWARRLPEADYHSVLESWLREIEKPESMLDLLTRGGR